MKDENPKDALIVEPLLRKNADGKERNEDIFHHRSTIGSLSHLEGCKRPDTSIVVRQVDKLSNCIKASHDSAVELIVKLFLGTVKEGIMHMICANKGLEVFACADFSGVFDKACAEDPTLVCSRTVFAIKCTGCSVTLKSKL